MNKNNLVEVLKYLVDEMTIPVTRSSIEHELEKHPNSDSLLALSELLHNWNIPNASFELEFEKLSNLPLPFIAYVSDNEFVTVTHLDKNHLTVNNEKWLNHKIPIDDFEKIYSGFILIAEKDLDSGEQEFKKKYHKEIIAKLHMPTILIGVSLVIIGLLFSSPYLNVVSSQLLLLTFFKGAGLVTTVFLLIQSVDTNNPLIQKLCGGDSKKDCNAILTSNAAKITENLSWSELGFFYFSGTFLVLLFSSDLTSAYQFLLILNLVCLPYTIYSIYYQSMVVKKWCRLCCVVQVLLWLEFFSFLPIQFQIQELPNLKQFCSLIATMFIPALFWFFIRPFIIKAQQLAPLRQQLRQFKYNGNLFQKTLNDQIKHELLDDQYVLVLGNRMAENVVTMVSNPYCQPCSRAHKILDEWLDNRDNIKLQVIFSVYDLILDPQEKVISHLFSLDHTHNGILLKNAMGDWYTQKQKDFETWSKKYPKNETVTTTIALEKQREWCRKVEIKGTPAVFINGHKVPIPYQLEDIKYFI